MDTLLLVIKVLLSLLLGGVLLWVCSRIISAAYFRSRREYDEARQFFDSKGKPNGPPTSV